jgi:hypothetical protein
MAPSIWARTGDHVLHIVGVARAVHVGVVAVGRLVLDVRRVDRDAARLFFGRRVDLVVGLGFEPPNLAASTVVIAAVSVVLPWSTCPIVPTLTWGLVRVNFSFPISFLQRTVSPWLQV